MKHLKSTAAFIRAVIGHWLGFVVTGGVGAVAAFVAELRGASVPGWLWAVIVAAGIIYACYKAFTDVLVERDTARSALEAAELALARKIENRSIRDSLGQFLAEGEALIERIEASVLERPMWQDLAGSAYTAIRERYSPQDWAPEVQQWSTTVEGYLRAHLGAGFVNRFRSTAGISPVGHVWLDYERSLADLLSDVSYRVSRIEQFMRELPGD